MRINHNIAALNTYRMLSGNQATGNKSIEKLSSGLRINRAGDDAAGLAISEKMRAQIRGLDQASRNAQDGISMIQTTEGALNETHSILQRMRELANQAANDTNVSVDREEIQKEINQLTSEINRIGNTTEFNTQKLLKGKTVAVVETAAPLTTITAGEAGVAVGDLSDLTVNAKSVLGVSSTATVQASTSKATGAISGVTENIQSIKGVKSSVTVPNGITFQSAALGDDINGKKVTILQGETVGAASKLEIDGEGNYIFTIGLTDGGVSRAPFRGDLYNELKYAIDQYDATTGFTATNKITVLVPDNTGEAISSLDKTGGTFSGGVDEQLGQYEFTLTNVFEEAGDTVTIDGQKFTAVLSGADATKGEFNIGPIEAKLSAGDNAILTNSLTASTTEKVEIKVGSTTYTITTANLQTLTGGQTMTTLTNLISNAQDASGNALSTVADVSYTGNKLTITAKTAQTPITWTASGTNAAKVNDTFGMNTVAKVTGQNVVDTTAIASGRAAIWDTGALDKASAAGTAEFKFNGVTVNITTATAGGTAVGAVSTAAKTVALTINVNTLNSASAQATAIISALNTYKSTTATTEFDNFTFSLNAGNNGIKITGTKEDGDNYSAQAMQFANTTTTGFGPPANVGTAQITTQGIDPINANTTITVTVDGKDYTISNNALKTALTGASSLIAMKTLIGNAVDSDGNLLSSAANVTDDGANHIVITSQNLKETSEIKWKINAGFAGDVTTLQNAFGLNNLTSDTGADAISESRTIIDQANSLAKAILNNAVLGARFGAYTDATAGTGADGKITLTEVKNQATGVVLSDPVVSGSGVDDKLVITNNGGQNLVQVNIARAVDQTAVAASATVGASGNTLQINAAGSGYRANGVKVALELNTTDALNVAFKDGVMTISLANSTDSKNTAALIQSAIRSLGTIDGINFTGWTATGGGSWDTSNNGSIDTSSATFSGGMDQVIKDQLNVTVQNGDLTIHLAGDAARENTAEKIQEKVQALGEFYYFDESGKWTSIDFSKYEFKAQGQWDTNTIGNSIAVSSATLVGGTQAVKGDYSFSIDKAFVAGDKVVVKGQVFTAVESGAVASKGEFNVAGGNLNSQAAGLIDAINLNSTLKLTYTASASGNKITLTENTATGKDLANSDLEVKATGTQGEYSIAFKDVMESGAAFILDGQEIKVSNKVSHTGYADGTAIKEATTVAEQTQALADAINKNSALSPKYTASVGTDGSLILKQTENYTSSTAPTASTKNSSEGKFTATFQVGANSGQSMTISVEDMRSLALGVSGDGTASTIAAKDGKVASYVASANVTNGTTNENVEFALDVSTHDKATAAVSVINDAIEAVSAQRSQLGAFQNRLEHTINNLGTSSENLTAAESRIRDVDMAKEMMEFTKMNILAQAAQAMLAQANQQPQGVLQLLR